MRFARHRRGLVGCAISFVWLACLDAASASAQPVRSTEIPCGHAEVRGPLGSVGIDPRFRHRVNLFNAAAQAPADRAPELYERAAAELECAIETNPSHPMAALAHYYVALSLEWSGRPRSAMERYLRIIRDYDSIHGVAGSLLDGEELSQRLAILEASTFRAAISAGRTFEFDTALRLYREVIRNARFAPVADHAEHVRDAAASIALLEQHPIVGRRSDRPFAATAEIEARLATATTPVAVASLAVELEGVTRRSRVSSVAARVALGDAYGRLAGRSGAGQGARWRRLAIEHYATAVHHAREAALPSTAAERALDRLHDDEYREQLTEVLPRQRRFPYRPGEFANNPPGALLLEGCSVAMPLLIGLAP